MKLVAMQHRLGAKESQATLCSTQTQKEKSLLDDRYIRRRKEAMGEQKQYYREINDMKGIAAVLVVLGHAIKQTGITNPVFEGLFAIIYSFHMPLFFFAAGFVGVKILKLHGAKAYLEYGRARFLRLMVPYFVVSLLYAPFKYFFSEYANEPYDFSSAWRIFIGESPDGALWFLYVLFLFGVVSAFLIKEKTLRLVLAVSFFLALASRMITWKMELGYQLTWYFFFFVLGLYVRTKYEKWKKTMYRGISFLLAAVIFVAGNVLVIEENAGYGELKSLADGMAVFTALAGIFLTMQIAKRMADTAEKRNGILAKTTGILGDYCMDIYILAEPLKVAVKIVFWVCFGWNYLLCTALCFILPLAGSVLVSKYILRRYEPFRVLILGMPAGGSHHKGITGKS
jgi:fucose 4-O-acetylase-like acetyltransferase